MYKLRPIIISGPSGSGKDTAIRKLIQKNPFIHDALGYTTRLPRENERNGVDMYFVTEEQFQKMINNNSFIEYAEFSGNRYGMPFSEVDLANSKLTIFNVGVSAAKVIKEHNKEAISILLLPPSKKELMERLGERGTERYRRAYFDVAYASRFFDFLVISHRNEVDRVVGDIEEIIFNEGEKFRVKYFKNFIDTFFD